MKYVKRGFALLSRHALTLLLVPLAGSALLELGNIVKSGQMREMWNIASRTDVRFNMVTFGACCALLLAVAMAYIMTRSKPVYLVDYHCFKAPANLKMPQDKFKHLSGVSGVFSEQSLEFQEKIMERSGLGDETYLPPAVQTVPPQINMQNARDEAEMVMFESVEKALKKTNLRPNQVDILVVNCSLFNPTPSLSAMIVNHFKFKSNIISYNLSGMGCSAGVIAVGLAKELLQVYSRSYALVVSTENITQNWYFGNQRSMLIPNCLFRIGGAAVILSNRRVERLRAKYELLHVVRTHMGSSDPSYGCVFQKEDSEGKVGVFLSKELMSIAGHALKANITTLGPLVLPLSEQILFFLNLIARKVLKIKMKAYIPDFKQAFEHFCIHTGGRGVIEEIEKQLQLTADQTKPSKEALYRFGNTSSSSIYYELSYIETMEGVRRGDRVWQIAFGSGFKCNSAVWRALRKINTQHEAWVEDEDEKAGSV